MTYLIQLLTIVQREGRKWVLRRRLLQLLLAQVWPHLQLLGLGRWRMEKTTARLLGTVHFNRNIGFWRKRKLRQAATSDFNQMTLKRPLKLNARPHPASYGAKTAPHNNKVQQMTLPTPLTLTHFGDFLNSFLRYYYFAHAHYLTSNYFPPSLIFFPPLYYQDLIFDKTFI